MARSPQKKPRKLQAADAKGSWAANDPDVQLMLRFQRGDQSAFDELVARNAPKVHALVFRFLGDPSQVEDITQEVFLRVFKTASRYTPTAKFTTWLYRIAANLSFNVLRSRGKVHPLSLDVGGGEDGEAYHHDIHDTQAQDPNASLSNTELRQKVAQAVDELPDSQKVAIILNKYEHKNYEEIAAVLQCTTMAVKSLLSRARANLQESLGRYWRL